MDKLMDQTHLEHDRVMERLGRDGSLEGDLNGRYARLRRRIALVEPGQWLYYAGASALKRCPNASRFAAEIIQKFGLPAGILRFEGCSGHDILSLGFEDIARNVAGVVTEQIQAAGVCGIFSGMEHDRWMFSNVYPRWDCDLAIPIVTASEFFGKLYTEGLVKLRPDTEVQSALYCGSLWSNRWIEDTETWQPALQAVFGERLTIFEEAASFIPPTHPDYGPARPDSGPIELPMDVIWEKIAGSGATLIITDDPFTYEALYDRAFRNGIKVWDFCHVFSRYLES
ncbi:MAG: (Fe-S)-binding protein [Armatimonadota bacterium]|nr:(Fe-S)-binding protein [Armatimonadota bacterium]